MKWQQETFLRNEEHYFISGTPHEEQNILGWNTPDSYEDCPLKYVEFFKNTNLEYDWYMFIDDDTFVFPKRLRSFVRMFDPSQKMCIGHKCDCAHLDYIDGGAGILMSRAAYVAISDHVKKTPHCELLGIHKDSKYGDVSLGLWLQNKGITFVNNRRLFKHFKHSSEKEISECITFHTVKSRDDFIFYEGFNNEISFSS
jgi:hypothetical protein